MTDGRPKVITSQIRQDVDAQGSHADRVIFQDQAGNPVDPFTGAPPRPPSPRPQDWTQQARNQTHVGLN